MSLFLHVVVPFGLQTGSSLESSVLDALNEEETGFDPRIRTNVPSKDSSIYDKGFNIRSELCPSETSPPSSIRLTSLSLPTGLRSLCRHGMRLKRPQHQSPQRRLRRVHRSTIPPRPRLRTGHVLPLFPLPLHCPPRSSSPFDGHLHTMPSKSSNGTFTSSSIGFSPSFVVSSLSSSL